jgi:hypothetical protein
VKVLFTDGTPAHNLEASAFEFGYDLIDIRETMAMKVIEEAPAFRGGLCEIDGEESPAGLQDPPGLAHDVGPRAARQVMQHESGDDYVDLSVGKRQILRGAFHEDEFNARSFRLLARTYDHLRRSVDATNDAVGANLFLGEDRKRACAAADIQHGFARLQARQAQHPLAELSLAAQGEEPDEKIIVSGSVDHEAGRFRPCLVRRSMHDDDSRIVDTMSGN